MTEATSSTPQTTPRSSSDTNKHHKMVRPQSLRVRVSRKVLEGDKAGPFRKTPLLRLVRHLIPKKTVTVEALSDIGLSASVFYCPLSTVSELDFDLAKTELTVSRPSRPSEQQRLVFRDSPFELCVAGMHVSNFDKYNLTGAGRNELLMYSMQTDPKSPGDTGEGLPLIHFDHNTDAYDRTERANTFIPIPASKSLVTGSPGSIAEETQPAGTVTGPPNANPKSVNVRFKILELDEPSENAKQAIQGIDNLSGVMGGFSAAAPMLGALTPALAVASEVGKRALDSYAQPDKVMSIDMDFALADRERVQRGRTQPGEYLRYGYYFFLSAPVSGQMYASVLTPQNVRLMLRRTDGRGGFFPLTGVSYLVVRVCEPMHAAPRPRRRPVMLSHARQLEDILSRADSKKERPEDLKKAMKMLGRELGVLMEDSSSESGSESSLPTLLTQ